MTSLTAVSEYASANSKDAVAARFLRDHPEVLSEVAGAPRHRVLPLSLLFSCLVSFHLPQRPPNSEHRENADPGHGVCQALTGAQVTQNTHQEQLLVPPVRARVKGIGPEMSEVSDVTTVQVVFYD